MSNEYRNRHESFTYTAAGMPLIAEEVCNNTWYKGKYLKACSQLEGGSPDDT